MGALDGPDQAHLIAGGLAMGLRLLEDTSALRLHEQYSLFVGVAKNLDTSISVFHSPPLTTHCL